MKAKAEANAKQPGVNNMVYANGSKLKARWGI